MPRILQSGSLPNRRYSVMNLAVQFRKDLRPHGEMLGINGVHDPDAFTIIHVQSFDPDTPILGHSSDNAREQLNSVRPGGIHTATSPGRPAST